MRDLPREVLRQIVVEEGDATWTSAQRCADLLEQKCGEYRPEISVLTGAIRENVVSDLLGSC